MYVPIEGMKMLIKTLQRVGNSSGLVFDKAIMSLMEIDSETPLKLTVEGRKLIVEPLTDGERKMKFEKLMKKTGRKNAELFRRLAK
jgi:antitoxin component of MazEF toxin-antitoxin module